MADKLELRSALSDLSEPGFWFLFFLAGKQGKRR